MNNTEWFKSVDERDVNIVKHISTLASNVESAKNECILLHAVLSQVNSRLEEITVSLANSELFDESKDLSECTTLLNIMDRIVDKLQTSNLDLSFYICELTVFENKHGKESA